ncbi:MAG: hypothetical protein ACHQVS_00410 [Candidatus Babeliales bacterium]
MYTVLIRFVLYCMVVQVCNVACAPSAAIKDAKKTAASCTSQKNCMPKSRDTQKLASNNATPKTTNTSKQSATSRTITVKSKITNEMLGYKKFGKHYPDKEFKIFINGQELVNRKEVKENKIKTVKATIKGDTLDIVFRYEFNHVWRNKGKGTRRCTFKIPPTADTVELMFNWKKDSQVLIKNIDGVKFIKIEDLPDQKK